MNTTEYAYLNVDPEAVYDCVCVCVLTARQAVLRLCRRSRASWVLARYWGSSACSSRMENGTMEPWQKGGREGQKENRREMGGDKGRGEMRNRVG